MHNTASLMEDLTPVAAGHGARQLSDTPSLGALQRTACAGHCPSHRRRWRRRWQGGSGSSCSRRSCQGPRACAGAAGCSRSCWAEPPPWIQLWRGFG